MFPCFLIKRPPTFGKYSIFHPLRGFSANNFTSRNATLFIFQGLQDLRFLDCVPNFLFCYFYLSLLFNFKIGLSLGLSCLPSSMFIIILIINSQLLKQTTSIIHHKPPQTTPNHQQMTTNDNKTHAGNYKLPQTTNKRLQTIKKKRTLATSKQTATPVHQTKDLTFCFSFPYSVVTMNTTILKSILFTVPNKWCGGGGGSPNPKGAWEV